MNEIMYDINTVVIALVLFVSMVGVIEFGFRVGRWAHWNMSGPARQHTDGIQASVLGILALLLGFTFSLALNRHDARSQAVVHEANAIGTTVLRAELLPDAVRSEARDLLTRYVDLRVAAAAIDLVQVEQRAALLAGTHDTQKRLWGLARRASDLAPNPVTTGLFVEALNDMIDAFGSRDAALNRHVPETVLFLLYGTFLMTGAIIGYTAGLAGHRMSFVTYILVALIVILVFIIVDLDRPRRGLIRVDQQSLVQLQGMLAGPREQAQPSAP